MGKNNYVIYNQDYFKELEEFDCSSLGTVIDSEKQYAEYPDNLTRYIFRMLYQTDDIDQAINMILEVVGKQFDVSRVYILKIQKMVDILLILMNGVMKESLLKWLICKTAIIKTMRIMKSFLRMN